MNWLDDISSEQIYAQQQQQQQGRVRTRIEKEMRSVAMCLFVHDLRGLFICVCAYIVSSYSNLIRCCMRLLRVAVVLGQLESFVAGNRRHHLYTTSPSLLSSSISN